ncbi:hypothetical protein SpCBS45565_g07534 [Spizellomyces sp. 'palustris']|nr:hypothetical protein SpCBS45565_g07534 [Spizellomyces sp. 'palustris']
MLDVGDAIALLLLRVPCAGSVCNGGRRTDAVGGFDAACSITTTRPIVTCTPVVSLTNGNNFEESNPDLFGFKTATVYGCAGTANSNACNTAGTCTCKFPWTYGPAWRCAAYIAPGISLLAPFTAQLPVGSLSVAWIDPWRPQLSLNWYEYVFGGYSNFIFDGGSPPASTTQWPVLSRTFKFVKISTGQEYIFTNNPPSNVQCPTRVARAFWWTCNFVNWEPAGLWAQLNSATPQPSVMSMALYVGLSSSVGKSTWQSVGTFDFVPPDPYQWQLTHDKPSAIYGSPLFIDDRLSLGSAATALNLLSVSTTKTWTVPQDRNTAKLSYSLSCVPQPVNNPAPSDPEFAGSDAAPMILEANMLGFINPLRTNFSLLPNVSEASCIVSGVALNLKGLNPDNVFGGSTPSDDLYIALLKVGPVVVNTLRDAPDDLPLDTYGIHNTNRFYWTKSDYLYSSWHLAFQGNSKVMKFMQDKTAKFRGIGNDATGIVQHTVKEALYIDATSQQPLLDYLILPPNAGTLPLTTLKGCNSSLGTLFPGLNGAPACTISTTILPGNTEEFIFRDSSVLTALSGCRDVGTLYQCVDCFHCVFRSTVTAYDAAANSVWQESYGVYYDGTDPNIASMIFPFKKAYQGMYWYGDLKDMKIDTRIYEPESALSSIALNIGVADFVARDSQIANFYGTYPILQRLNKTAGSLLAVADGWSGFSLHEQIYNVEIAVRSIPGRSTSKSARVIPDATPPRVGSVKAQQLIYNPASADPLKISAVGFVDTESGVRDYYVAYKIDSNLHCAKKNFIWPPESGSGWQLISDAAVDRYDDMSAKPSQTFNITLGQNQTQSGMLYVAVAAVNHAISPYGAVEKSATVTCGWPVVLDNGVPTVYVKSLLVDNDMTFSTEQNRWMVNRVVNLTWAALHIPGVSYYNLSLAVDSVHIADYSGVRYDSDTILFQTPAAIPVDSNFTVAITAVNYAGMIVGPKIVSIIVTTPEPDLSTCASAVIVSPNDPSPGVGTIKVDWTRCVSPTEDVDHWNYYVLPVGSEINSTLTGTPVSANITEITVPVQHGPHSLVKVCIAGYQLDGNVTSAFCSSPAVVDTTPPIPSGSVRDLHPVFGVPVQTSVNATALRFGWDTWIDAETIISNYTLTLVCNNNTVGEPVTLPSNQHEYTFMTNQTDIFLNYTGIVLRPGDYCYGKVYATNVAGLSSEPVRSPGVKIVNAVVAEQPGLKVLDGVAVSTTAATLHFFPALPEATFHLMWGGFISYADLRNLTYEVRITSATNPSSVNTYTFQKTLDAVIPLPSSAGAYLLNLNLVDSGTVISTVTSNEEIVVLSEGPVRTPPLTLTNNYCEIHLNEKEGNKSLGDSLLKAYWPPFEDPFGIIQYLQVAFRQKSHQSFFSEWTDARVNATDTEFVGMVSWPYGVPEVLWSQDMECVVEAVDLLGNRTQFIMPGWLSEYPWFQPTAVDVSSWTVIGKPKGVDDYSFFEDVSVTPNSSYAIGWAGFPAFAAGGETLATLSYSVGDSASSGAPNYFDNIIPTTQVDIANAMIILYSTKVLDNPIPFYVFQIPNFVLPTYHTVYACITVTQLASGNSTVACTDGIIYSPTPPVQGTVSLNNAHGFVTSFTSLTISWGGFYVNGWPDTDDKGIAYFAWGVGSYPGWDDVVSTRHASSLQQIGMALGLRLLNGDTLYATVTAYSHAGLGTTSISTAAIVDYTGPISDAGITSISVVRNTDGSYNVRVMWDTFDDLESSVVSVGWIIETEYGLQDVLPLTATDTPIFATGKSLALSAGVDYIARVIATNGAGLTQEVTSSFEVDNLVRIVYVASDGPEGAWSPYTGLASKYSFSWEVTGHPLYFLVAVGTRAKQHDVEGWVRLRGSARQFELDLSDTSFTDGETLYGTVYAFDSNGVLADQATTSGKIIDSSPPAIGKVVHGAIPYIHQPFVDSIDHITASWSGFTDADSGIALYEVCVDSSPVANGTLACSNLDWKPANDRISLMHLVMERLMMMGSTYYIKVKATNGAGLFTVGVSPPILIDAGVPSGGSVTVGFPSQDSNFTLMTSHSDQLYYLDRTVIQISWEFSTAPISGIANYDVGLYEKYTSMRMTPPTTVPGGINSWTFTAATRGFTLEDGREYVAVVLATSGSRVVGEVKSRSFMVDSTAPPSGAVDVTFLTPGYSASSTSAATSGISSSGAPSSISSGISSSGVASNISSGISSSGVASSISSGISSSRLASSISSGISSSGVASSISSGISSSGVASSISSGIINSGASSSTSSYNISVAESESGSTPSPTTIPTSSQSGSNSTEMTDYQSSATISLMSTPSILPNPINLRVKFQGFSDAASGVVLYRVDVGFHPYGTQIATLEVADTCETCSATFSADLRNRAMYFATVYARDAAGLWSRPATSGRVYSANGDVLVQTTTNPPFQWTIDAASPTVLDFVAQNGSAIMLTGRGLNNFIKSGDGAMQPNFTCLYSLNVSTDATSISTSLSLSDRAEAQILCKVPDLGLGNATAWVNLTVVPTDAVYGTSSMIWLQHMRRPVESTSWRTNSTPSIGLASIDPPYRLTPWTWAISWPNDITDAAYYQIEGFNNVFAVTSGRSTSALFTIDALSTLAVFAQAGTFQWTVCAFFYGDRIESVNRRDCIRSDPVRVDLTMLQINPLVNAGYDSAIPTAVRIVGYGSDVGFEYETVQFQDNITRITANWTDSFIFPPESAKRVARFDIFAGYQPYATASQMYIVGSGPALTSVSFDAALVPGVPYYVTVVAWDNTGLPNIHTSAPLTCDITPPTVGTIYDGSLTSISTTAYQANTTELQAYWRGFVDSETVLKQYEYQICLDNSTCVGDPQSAGMHTRAKVTDLRLEHGQHYHFRLKAQNAAGHWTRTVFSRGVTIDTTPPIVRSVRFGNGGPVAIANDPTFALNWSFTDPESPIVEYQVQLGTTDGGSQILPLTSLSTQTSLPLSGLHLEHGTYLYATVIARNAAGLSTVAQSYPIMIDLTPPKVVGTVVAFHGMDFVQGVGSVEVVANWENVFTDGHSEIVEYQYAVGKVGQPTFFMNFTSVNKNVSIPSGGLITVGDGDRVTVSVKAVNQAGLSIMATSAGVGFTNSPPSSFTIQLLDSNLRTLTTYYDGVYYIRSAADLHMRLVGLSDLTSGIAFLEMQLNKLGATTPVFDWTRFNVSNEVKLNAPEVEIGVPLSVSVRATNRVGLTANAQTDWFVVTPGPPDPATVELSWNLDTSPYSIVTLITGPRISNATGPLAYTLGVFSSRTISAFNVYPRSAITVPGNGSSVSIAIPLPAGASAYRTNFTAVLEGTNLVGDSRTVVTLLEGLAGPV